MELCFTFFCSDSYKFLEVTKYLLRNNTVAVKIKIITKCTYNKFQVCNLSLLYNHLMKQD